MHEISPLACKGSSKSSLSQYSYRYRVQRSKSTLTASQFRQFVNAEHLDIRQRSPVGFAPFLELRKIAQRSITRTLANETNDPGTDIPGACIIMSRFGRYILSTTKSSRHADTERHDWKALAVCEIPFTLSRVEARVLTETSSRSELQTRHLLSAISIDYDNGLHATKNVRWSTIACRLTSTC